SGSTGPFTYAWTGPGGPYSTEDLSNIQDGSYTVVVTDVPSGCTATANITVNNTAPTLTLTSTVTPNSRCVAPFNGAIDLTVSGSTGPFTYAWTGPGGFTSASEDISNLQPGIYDVTVTDNPSSCVVTASFTVNDISVVPTLTSTVVDNDRCNAPFNGAILLTVSPSAFYTFSWTGPGGYTSSLEDITALAPGLYTVTVTNPTTGCSTNQSFTVNNIAPTVSITLNAIGPNSSCSAPFNGFILVTVSPAGSYTYSWTGPSGYTSSSEDISGLREGDYTLTATNTSLGCSATSTFTVGDLTPTISITSQTIVDNSNCVAPFNGSITIAAGGTPGPYTYTWTGPGGYTGTGSSISGLQSGNYTVTITDLTIGCQDVYTLTVGDATPPITVTLDAMSPNTNCLAPFTGALSITVSGTPGPFTYSWSGPGGYTSTNEDISGLEQGDYQVTVQDTGLGCQATVTFTVGDGRPVVGITGLSVNPNSNCVAPFTGSISLSGSGTPGPFTYSWTGPGGFTSSSQNISGLNSGDYTVTVRDQILGCEGVFTINVPSTAPTVTLTSSVSGNTTCIPPFNGSINITAGGTPGPYSYSWTGPGGYTSSNEDISNLQAGDYTVIVQDTGLGCQGTFTITVPENAPVLNITLVSNTPNSNCLAPFNGALDITISGTPGPYIISWSGPGGFSAASEDISGLRPGVYNLSVQDVLLGCVASASFTVNNVASGCGGLGCLAFTVTTTEVRPSCAVQDDGSITFTISGGTPNYIVTLTDSAGFTVSKPGAGPVFSFTNLSPANYYYIIQDASFPSPNVCALPYSLPVQTNVQATATGFVDAACFGQPTGQATLTVISGGASPYEYSIDAGANWISFTSPHTITNLPPNGTYSILVRDDASDLCPAQVPVTINNLNPQIQQPFAVQQATCSNNDGKIILTGPPSGGTGAPYSYLLNGVPTVPSGGEFANLSAGTYVLTVQDNSGCQRNFNVTITFPGFVNTSPVTVSPPDCTSGGTNGSISFNILDIGTFSFFVTTNPLYVPVASDYIALGGTFVLIPNLVNGTYYVWLKSAGAQCATRLGPVNVTGVYALSYSFTPSDEICFGDGGSVTLTGITGAPNLNYQYELVLAGVPTSGTITFLESLGPYTISGLAPGNYQIRLTQDQTSLNGCVAVTPYQSFTITGPASALGFTGVENISESYPDQPTGSMIVVIAESGEEPYELRVELTEPILGGQAYLRDFQVVNRNPATLRIQEQFISLYAGVYTLTVRDALGCVRTTEVEVPVDTDIFIPNMFTPNGDGVNDVFFIRNLPEGSRLIITNRWGNQVFQSANYPVNASDAGLWDGGNESDGVYYYRLQAAGQVYTGWVEIVRGRKP
ncbi:MAG: gliding motility-associated C-terminal domain-containing protein, partial [Cyclobacteriaceae bacterium]|nr:gliding motility-associated C-terminal domain-containing protein [Cyclobacteriaceae bacterium]